VNGSPDVLRLLVELLLPWLFYPVIVYLLASYYLQFIKGGGRGWRRIAKVLVLATPIALFVAMVILVYSIMIQNLWLFACAVLVALAGAISLRNNVGKGLSCRKEEEREIDGLKYVVCHTDAVNAWYNPRTERIYVSKPLAELLTEGELRAVLYHELGHAENKLLRLISALLYAAWLLALSGIVIFITALQTLPVSVTQFVTWVSALYWFASNLTVSAMVPSWVAEHESDGKALDGAGLKSIIGVLVKLYIYSSVTDSGLAKFVSELKIEAKDPEVLKEVIGRFGSLAAVFRTLAIYGLKFPKWVWDYIRRPIYPTHPPLELRLAYLLHNANAG